MTSKVLSFIKKIWS